MARITYVKKAQQRYETVPVLNDDGTIKRTPVMRADGTQKTTKTGRPVFTTVTVKDKTKPLPNHTCGKCHTDIKPGDPYKHISPRSGPYGGRTLYRCGNCPNWHRWEYSSSLSARCEQIAYDAESQSWDCHDDVKAILEDAAQAVRDLAEEKRESAQNIEDGFGRATYQSDELNEVADNLDSWADDIENADIPEDPEPEEDDCDECNGEGYVDVDCEACEGHGQNPDGDTCGHCDGSGTLNGEDVNGSECGKCDGSGQFTPDEPTEDQWDEWRNDVEDALSVLGDSPA